MFDAGPQSPYQHGPQRRFAVHADRMFKASKMRKEFMQELNDLRDNIEQLRIELRVGLQNQGQMGARLRKELQAEMKENMGDVANRVQAMEKYLTYNVLDSIFFSGNLLMPVCGTPISLAACFS